jgi:hypothetical protein
MTSVRCAAAAMLAALMAGCATTSPAPSGTPSPQPRVSQGEAGAQAPRTINRNLSGYSLAFKQGYVEGCESAGSGSQRRDESRYKSDMDYSMGWNDGFSVCRR